ncbi:hypothetical protein [Celerinatantimonas yamalensis]|uniref:ElaB/YqjD/DUF883 family membrane-anchored ribosome-binding protein n=1 Tax=Celerinatantimonas yamalensis TaxID=559956 RepID=A0ABW9G291_9GAMM
MTTANSKATDPTKEQEIEASKVAVTEAYEKLMEAKNHFKAAAESAGIDMKSDAVEQLKKGRDKASDLTDQATTYMKDNPLATMCIAFAAGFIASKFLTRK